MIIVRYTVKPGQADPNAELIRAVLAELASSDLSVSYSAYRSGDTFVHVADGDGLTELPAFRAFVAGHSERCVAPAEVLHAEQLGLPKGA